MTAFRGSSATDAGRVRSSNQDLSFVSTDLVAVADGMGGHVGGEIAARLAIDTLRRAFADDRSVPGVTAATQQANRAVFEQSEREPTLRGMGTTLTAAAIVRAGKGRKLVVSNVGDSRAYVLRDGRLDQLTQDHSLVEEMVRNGELSPAEAAVHPHRHILTRALGIDRTVAVDAWEIEPSPGARLLLCSDGLTNEVSENDIATILSTSPEPSNAAKRLVAAALEHGGSDNVTVVVVDIDESATSPADEAPPGRRARGSATEAGVVAGTGAVAGAGAAGAVASAGRGAGSTVPLPTQPPGRPSGEPHARRQRSAEQDRRRVRRADRVLSLRVVLFVVIFVGVLGGAAGVVGWYVKASYFVGIDEGHVTVFEGRPGGFLWFKPQILDKTSLVVSQVFPPNVAPLRSGMLERSYAQAETIVSNLTNEHHSLALPKADTSGALGIVGTTTTLPPTTTTSTTIPAKKTTPAKKTKTTAKVNSNQSIATTSTTTTTTTTVPAG